MSDDSSEPQQPVASPPEIAAVGVLEPARVHPLTPFVRGWGYLVGAVAVIAQNEGLRSELSWAVIGLLGVFIGGVVLGGLSWWFTK